MRAYIYVSCAQSVNQSTEPIPTILDEHSIEHSSDAFDSDPFNSAKAPAKRHAEDSTSQRPTKKQYTPLDGS